MARLAFPADQLSHMLKLLGHALVVGDDLVEGVGDLAEKPGFMTRHPDREIAGFHRLKRMKQTVKLRRMSVQFSGFNRLGRRGRDRCPFAAAWCGFALR